MAKDNATIGGFDTSGDDTLLLDNATYNQIQNKLIQSASELIFNKSAFDMEDAVCGTEGMVLLADYWHRVVDSSDRLRDFLCEDVDMMCTKVQDSINETDHSIAASFSCSAIGAGKSMLGAFLLGGGVPEQEEEPEDTKGAEDTNTVEKIDDEFGDIQIAYHFDNNQIQYLKVHARYQLEMLRVVQKYSSADAERIVAILNEKLAEMNTVTGISDEGFLLLCDYEVGKAGVYDKDGNLTALKIMDVGDGKYTLGFGITVDKDDEDAINYYMETYGIDVTNVGGEIDIDTSYKIYHEKESYYTGLVNSLCKRNNFSPTQQQYDALFIAVYNRPLLAKEGQALDVFLKQEGGSKEDFEQIVLSEYQGLGSWDKYGDGWTNRTYDESELYFDGDYERTH
ncbi:hypothetical protein D6856_03500 [Butyrivibrio sp. XB500-5]|uniref:hypothetical protein n=1 Tax=Butyrivibrio sp. XB500-5 TaxID=2364880 RepID=UPI000EA8DC9A|nr:hypothetical protein [Butyrivibrio sp. XB500-5]RKM63201.1 hypothetical protein D6856_03500 [Butyrivibrio sp. XB500-5]